MKLEEIAYFVTENISSSKIKLEQYVTTDSLLQNKLGRQLAVNLPPQTCSLTSFKIGDVLIGNIRPYLKKIWLADTDGGASKDVLVLRAKDNISSNYLYSLLLQDFFFDFVMKAPMGSKMPRGNPNHIMNFPIKKLEDKEISCVGNIIVEINKQIAVNNRINDNLSQSIKTLFDYWFTQFEFPNASGKPYKSTNGAFTYNQDLKKDIPNGWQVIKLSTIADVLSGFAFSTNDYVDNGIYNLLTIKNVQDDGINIKFDNHLNQIPNRMPDYCSLKIGDILISLTGNVGRVGIVYTENNLLNQRVAKIQPKSHNLYGFIYAFLKNDLTRKKIETLAIGSSQANLSPLDIENQLFAFDVQICQNFSSKVKPLIDKYISNCIENTNLINLRDCLLPLLMNGQVTITE